MRGRTLLACIRYQGPIEGLGGRDTIAFGNKRMAALEDGISVRRSVCLIGTGNERILDRRIGSEDAPGIRGSEVD